METFILERLREEVTIRSNQYGGIRGSGMNNFLIRSWHNILSALDTPNSAVALLSIDFSKVFKSNGPRLLPTRTGGVQSFHGVPGHDQSIPAESFNEF